jgi:hypothetical protein
MGQKIDLSKLSATELKAIAYDAIQNIKYQEGLIATVERLLAQKPEVVNGPQ